MNRWLLNTFPTWALFFIVVGGLVLLAWGGFVLTRRKLPHLLEGENNDVAGVVLGILVGVYGIVLAFVIVALYEGFQGAQETVRSEATQLSQLDRDSEAFRRAEREAIDSAIGRYVHAVIEEEWPAMADGHESAAAWQEIDRLYRVLQNYVPEGDTENTFYGEAVSKLNDLVSDRRSRLNDAREELPRELQILVIAGALMVIAFLYVLYMPNQRAHLFMVLAVAALLGFNLLLAIVLDHPFSGDVTVSYEPFQQGSLAHHFR